MITLDEGTQDYIKEFKVKEKPVYSFVKRAFDFGASLVGLVCLSPVLLVTGVAVVLIIHYFDNSIKGKEDIEESVGIPLIGLVPVYNKKRKNKRREIKNA